jgi:N-acetyl-anhydromuramyl-L-alanine amidase AmpD
MAGYSKRHYGQFKWQLRNPKLVVIHYAEAGTVGSIYNTFAPNRPDPEFNELPNVCAHFAISAGGAIYKLVPVAVRCRHVVGLNHVAIGIEHVGFSDSDVLNRPAQLNPSLKLSQWLRCRFGLPVEQVIGHNESLDSPFYRERDPDFRGQTHGDFSKASMDVYRGKLRQLGAC